MENVAGFEAKLQANEIEPTGSLDSSHSGEHDSKNNEESNKIADTIHSDFLYTIENVEMTSPVIETISDPKNSQNSLKPKVNFEKSMWDDSKGLKIGDFIDNLSDADFKTYAIDQKVLDSHGYVFDVVMPSSSRSCCFTKSYKHYNEGTGSVLQISGTVGIDKQTSENTRYFTEYEVARLLGFPNDFSFTSKSPNDKSENVTLKQCYKLLGNSLSVIVVSNLLTRLIKQM
ncbi:tRNA (cytosine(38)-C(5))-methyltransferase [Smittium culicis]|uniref:tRNA (cytosine(38)-C(5))-methyltransferase n=1 Tax=Smittium culicis TaxID=133412 RepID=A0A1R1XGQ0_9FUNG|nr:tRNA (cytosine(38)-C(5))-methyltransferase [Smittium culicis]OMJ25265.1 tRNA (cytosine(38)-C(5))-methyltransferase [Smittium culicis]